MHTSHYALTASQTIGPFFHDALLRPDAQLTVLTTPATLGERIRITGRIYDGDGASVPDAMLEIWQANAAGCYNHAADMRDVPLDPTFIGYGRSGTDADGFYSFDTIKPGRVPFDEARLQAPHICITVFARGLLNHLYTRLYFGDDSTTAQDPVLLAVPIERRTTLVARPIVAQGEQQGFQTYQFDIILQGDRETVFFNI